MNYTLLEEVYDARRFHMPKQTAEHDECVANALSYVIQNVLSNITNAFTFTISATTNPEVFWFRDLISKLLATCSYITVQLVMHNNWEDMQVPGRRYCNLILVDSFENLKNIKISQSTQNYDSKEYYFIFLQIRDSLMTLHRDNILKYCFDNYWLHCNVMIQNARGEVLIYTYFPFQESDCYNTDAVLVNHFNGERFVNSIMFPNKANNLHGCPLILTADNIPPFVIYPQADEDFSGLEVEIVRTLGRLMNFSIEIANTTGVEEITEETILLEMPQNPIGNITAGYMRRTSNHDSYATPSYMTYYIPLVPVILRRLSQNESLDILVFPFDKLTWIFLATSCLLLMIINTLKERTSERPYSNLHFVEALLGLAAQRVPRPLSLKTCFIIWVLSSFLLRSIFQSLLFYLYRTHFYQSPPTTMAALVQDNYTAVCTRNTEPFLKYIPEFMNNSLPLLVLNTSNEIETLKYLTTYRDQNLMAVSTEDFIMYFLSTDIVANTTLLVPNEVLINQQISLYLSKHYCLIERIDDFLLRFHQAGLLERWRKESLGSTRLTKRVSSTAYEKELMVNMKHVMGFIKIIIMLDFIAVIVFLVELLSQKVVWLQKIL